MDEEANSGRVAVAVSGAFAVLAVVQISLTQGGAPQPRAAPGVEGWGGDRPAAMAWGLRQLAGIPWTLRIGPQRPDLLRYNRVEALSVGVRGQLRPSTPWGPLSLTATGRFGLGDLHPNGRLDVARETVERRIVLSGYHELAPIDERAGHLGPVSSLMALMYGRDDGDYYRRSGATLEVTPPSARPRTFRLRVFGERHESVDKETDVQLPRLWDEDQVFRPNIVAGDGWLFGAGLDVERRLGTDPFRSRGGFEGSLGAAFGDFEYQRVHFGLDGTVVLPGRFGLFVESAAGTVRGTPPPQRRWYVGGPTTLRGYAPRAAGGKRFWRARAELFRRYAFGRVLVFSDAAWAGGPGQLRSAGDALYSAGAGLAIIDGILRIDGAWQLESPGDFRLDVYLEEAL